MTFPHRFAAVASALVLASVPVCVRAAGEQPVDVSATDQMKFVTTDIAGKVGQKLTIHLTNDGSMPKATMGHNLVVLKPGTDVDVFLAAAKRSANDYIPDGEQADHMLIHTKLLGPGEEDTISFTPLAPGVYEYVCTYPDHAAAGMRGRITVK